MHIQGSGEFFNFDNPSTYGIFSVLPLEITKNIFQKTNKKDLISFSLVNRNFLNLYGLKEQIDKLKLYTNIICDSIKDESPAIHEELKKFLKKLDEEIITLPPFKLLGFLNSKRKELIDILKNLGVENLANQISDFQAVMNEIDRVMRQRMGAHVEEPAIIAQTPFERGHEFDALQEKLANENANIEEIAEEFSQKFINFFNENASACRFDKLNEKLEKEGLISIVIELDEIYKENSVLSFNPICPRDIFFTNDSITPFGFQGTLCTAYCESEYARIKILCGATQNWSHAVIGIGYIHKKLVALGETQRAEEILKESEDIEMKFAQSQQEMFEQMAESNKRLAEDKKGLFF